MTNPRRLGEAFFEWGRGLTKQRSPSLPRSTPLKLVGTYGVLARF
ncbi:MAG TPA: hypothetical protein VM822_08340 [Pseudolabrys sp.]|jgi:hypothetical protein|nr:hypothetical protein [Pseudolabrys sp.]